MMMRRWLIISMILVTCMLSVAAADDADDRQTLRELKQRFKERFPTLVHLRREGKVGETWEGWVRAVDDDFRKLRLTEDGRIAKDQSRRNDDRMTVGALIDEENADREKLYRIIAERQDTTPQLVGERNARRLFEEAEPGTYLKKDGDSDWERKPEPDDDDER